MSILIDERARHAIERRRAAGKPAAVDLHVTPVPRGGFTLSVGWGRTDRNQGMLSERQAGTELRADPRIRRYARWQNIVISAQRLGPFEALVLDDPLTLLRIRRWEKTHPNQTQEDRTPVA